MTGLPMSEDQLKQAVLELCAHHKLLVHHDRPARKGDGTWATHIEGDAGFPDLVIAGPAGVAYVELKTDLGELSAGQKLWRTTLFIADVHFYLWRPKHLRNGAIANVLRNLAKPKDDNPTMREIRARYPAANKPRRKSRTP